MNGRLPFKQRKFIANYILLAGNGSQAVIAAGYKQTYGSARVTACRLLTKANVMAEIESHVRKAKLDANQVIEELSDIAQTSTIIDGNQRLRALELLGKFHKLFTDRIESTDLTQASATESALLKSIAHAASRDHVTPESAAVQLFQALADDPQFTDLNAWPAEYRAAIQASQTQPAQAVTEIQGEQ